MLTLLSRFLSRPVLSKFKVFPEDGSSFFLRNFGNYAVEYVTT